MTTPRVQPVRRACPHCGYDRARGDRRENRTRVLDPTDLIDPRSAISGSTELEVRETKHLARLPLGPRGVPGNQVRGLIH